jgi:hypothetical protein
MEDKYHRHPEKRRGGIRKVGTHRAKRFKLLDWETREKDGKRKT